MVYFQYLVNLMAQLILVCGIPLVCRQDVCREHGDITENMHTDQNYYLRAVISTS